MSGGVPSGPVAIALGRIAPSAVVVGSLEPGPLSDEVLEARAAFRVALLALPWAQPFRPSVQLGLLSEIGRRHGFSVDTHHLYLDLVRKVGPDAYHRLCAVREPMLGDWLFSVAAFGDDSDPTDELLDHFGEPLLEKVAPDVDRHRLVELRHDILPRFVDSLVDAIEWGRYRAVGFTSTFQQNGASFALARRLKARWPGLFTIFGGANFEGPMGEAWVRGVTWIDAAVSGEGDRAFPALLDALCRGDEPDRVAGVIWRRPDGRVTAVEPAPALEDLDGLPTPDYAEFFARAERLELLEPSAARAVDLPFETARGCWWGAKRHCTFCGLNGQTMRFRSKSPERVLAEVGELSRRYGSFQMESVDNILDLDYLDKVLDPLATIGADYRFFFEVKANLDRSQVRRLRNAGVTRMQPGVESLSTHVLTLMRKGIRAAHNVNLLRWAAHYRITTGWNILYGFPGETVVDYDEQAALLAQLVHLEPPIGCGPIRMDRFSPIFDDRDSWPVRDMRPERSYRFVYPSHIDLFAAAYHFEGELIGSLPDETFEPTKQIVNEWKARHHGDGPKPSLVATWAPGMLHIDDRRAPDQPLTYAFADPLAALYMAAFEAPVTAAAVKLAVELPHPVGDVEAALEQFCSRGLMMRDGNLFLALALPSSPMR